MSLMLVYGRCSGFANPATEVPRTDPDLDGMCRGENCVGDWENTGFGKRDVN
jgi:hypothetical protein